MITRKAKYIFKSQNYTQKLYRPVPVYRHGTILNANYAICSSFFHPLGRAILPVYRGTTGTYRTALYRYTESVQYRFANSTPLPIQLRSQNSYECVG